MTPFHSDPWLTVYQGDCRAVLATLRDESVHCVVTSPPYWGLRDYGTATWLGGDEGCDHVADASRTKKFGNPAFNENRPSRDATKTEGYYFDKTCGKCGATRQDNQLGLEPTPEQYVENMVAVFREVRRVLRNDGTLWLNLGDSYAAGGRGTSGHPDFLGNGQAKAQEMPRKEPPAGLKPKDLVGIPWRVAFALQADGWYLRSDIIWAKPNPMPESVTDRPTKSHEYLFLLAKSERYYFDADAVRETSVGVWNSAEDWKGRAALTAPEIAKGADLERQRTRGFGTFHADEDRTGRNIRSVWNIATQPYPGAHFATFPPKLVEPCIKAGTSERGVCPECGAPWRRQMSERPYPKELANAQKAHGGVGNNLGGQRHQDWLAANPRSLVGWQPACAHEAEPVAATVLDPFAGSGTTLMVAQQLSRRAVGIDLSMDYLGQLLERNRQTPLGLAG